MSFLVLNHGDQRLLTTLCRLDIHYSERDKHQAKPFFRDKSRVRGHVKLVSRPLHLTMPLGSKILKGGNTMIKKGLSNPKVSNIQETQCSDTIL